MSVLAEFVDKIISLKEPRIIDVAGEKYSNQRFERIRPRRGRMKCDRLTHLQSAGGAGMETGMKSGARRSA